MPLKILNGLILKIRMGKCIRNKWVNTESVQWARTVS